MRQGGGSADESRLRDAHFGITDAADGARTPGAGVGRRGPDSRGHPSRTTRPRVIVRISLALLESQAATRVAELVPIRYGRMLASPFSFYQGAALMHGFRPGDRTGIPDYRCSCAGTRICRTSVSSPPERNLVFDIDDFDETLPGPWEWDIKRLLASLAVAGRSNGFDAPACEHAVRAGAEGYRQQMHRARGDA